MEKDGWVLYPVTLRRRGSLQEPSLILVAPRHLMTGAATRLIRLVAANLNDGRVVSRGASFHEPLVPARRRAAQHADRVKLVDHLGYGHQVRHRPERFATEIGIRARNDHPPASGGE